MIFVPIVHEKKNPSKSRVQFKSRFISFLKLRFFQKIVSLLYFTRARIYYLFDPIFPTVGATLMFSRKILFYLEK